MSEPEPQEGAATSPEALERTRAHVGFPCGNCGAELTWDPEADALACAHCGEKRAVPRATGEIVERPLEAAGDAARGLGLETRAVRCGTCGAQVSLSTVDTAAACVFCGSSNVLVQEERRNALRPESLIPLDVGRGAVEKSFRSWVSGLWFRPDALKKLARFEAKGVYVPYWTFDCAVHSDWSADAGYYYYETQIVPVMVNGRVQMQTRQVRKVRWVPAWGARDDAYDDVLVHASKGVSESLAAKLGAFDTKQLVPYRPEYLAGWSAEEYQLDLEGAWNVARERVVAIQESRCSGDVPGDTQRALRVSNRIEDVRWKHVLLPIWTLSYAFAGKHYTVLVHGQNGRVEGEAPLSWVKILAFALAMLALLGIAALAALVLSQS